LAFLWPYYGGVLYAADTANTILGLGWHKVFVDLAEGKLTLAKLARLDFEVACFGHGGAIVGESSSKI
jgi:hypothetical protein